MDQHNYKLQAVNLLIVKLRSKVIKACDILLDGGNAHCVFAISEYQHGVFAKRKNNGKEITARIAANAVVLRRSAKM